MPFIAQTPRIYNQRNVEALKLDQMGVYGLLHQNNCIYIGKGDIRTRLLAHLNGDNPMILKHQPTHWVDEVTVNLDAREIELIQEMNPVCNQRIG